MQTATLPCRAGVGFKPEHFDAIMEAPQPVGFFEVHAENYMGDGGRPHAQLELLRRDYALSVHGVGLSIGSMQPLDRTHLARLKRVCDRYEPTSVSEHLAWSSHDGLYFNDLLPLPYTAATLDRVADHIDEIQTTLGRQMLLENPASYVSFKESTLDEADFLSNLAKRTGCGLLLDLNNVFVAAVNHGHGPRDYLASFPMEAVGEIHLGGHRETTDATGCPLLIDTHDGAVADPVWQLYRSTIVRAGAVATLIEWDDDLPEWPDLLREAEDAQAILDRNSHRAG